MKKFLLFIYVFVFLLSISFGNTIYTTCNGNWNDLSIWQGGALPAAGDSIYINHNIMLTSNLNLDDNFLSVSSAAEICGLYVINVDTGSFVVVDGVVKSSNVNLSDQMIVNGRLYTNLFVSSSFLTINGLVVIGWSGVCSFVDSILNVATCAIYTSPSGNYTWTSSGVYSDTIPSASGCDSIITINLTIQATKDSINPTACQSYTSPSGNYTWTSSGIYSDTIPNSFGCDSVITINLTINKASSASIIETACGSYISPSGNYTWTSSSIYSDTIPNNSGCDSLITVNLTINNSTSSTISDTVCNSYTSPSGNYTWTNSGIYLDTLWGANYLGCDSVININLTVNQSDSANITYSPNNYCLADLTSLPIITGTLGGNFTVNNSGVINPSTGQIDLLTSGIGSYTITYITTGNCPDTTETNVIIDDYPPVVGIASSQVSICVNECIDFIDLSTSKSPMGITSWEWSFVGSDSITSSQQNPINICYSDTGIYLVRLRVIDGNSIDDSTFLNYVSVDSCIDTTISKPSIETIVPNVFSPNGDDENELFIVIGDHLSNMDMQIYNRWGQLIFETNQINEGWNGITTAGVESSEGTYFYIIHIDEKEARKSFKGTLTLIR